MHMRTLLLLHTGLHWVHTGITRGSTLGSHGVHMGFTWGSHGIKQFYALLTGGGGGGVVKCTTSYEMKELTGASI